MLEQHFPINHQSERAREDRLRRRAARAGLALQKSRVREPHLDDFGRYRLINRNHNWIVAGERFDLDLDAVEAWLAEFE